MKNYNTIEEKTLEWNVSARYIQHLCRTGKIEGAIKRAGSWFIPDDTPVPIKNTKSNVKDYKFVGTKSKIFDCAIEMFMLRGFNDVSLRDIAQNVGIRQSTIYNHFRSKQEILDVIYDFYCYYFLRDRPSLDDAETVLKNGNLMDVIRCIRYDFKEDYEQRMADISKIIFQRMGIDARANEIAKSVMVDEGVRYVEAVFDKAVETGRLAPFDTHVMAVFINSIRVFTLYNWIVDPSLENMTKLAEDEQAIYKYAASFITDLKPQPQP